MRSDYLVMLMVLLIAGCAVHGSLKHECSGKCTLIIDRQVEGI